MITKAFLMILF